MYSIKELCVESHLSRSTLLYYDNIGLLKPAQRTESNYRKYSEEDKERLKKICTFREAGIPLEQIKRVLETDYHEEQDILTEQLQKLNNEIKQLRLQQKFIVELLKRKDNKDVKMLLDKDTFRKVLETIGFEEDSLDDFHKRFEEVAPEAHHFFLEFLGFMEEDINAYRENL